MTRQIGDGLVLAYIVECEVIDGHRDELGQVYHEINYGQDAKDARRDAESEARHSHNIKVKTRARVLTQEELDAFDMDEIVPAFAA